MQNEEFAGANKVNTSFLKPLERRLEPIVLPRIPYWLETSHLTMLTVIWCAGILGFSYLAASDRRWLWAVSVMIFCQYLTDHFDGKIGKYRSTGLERWGYYMDHLLDYFFLASVIVGYAFILPERSRRFVFWHASDEPTVWPRVRLPVPKFRARMEPFEKRKGFC